MERINLDLSALEEDFDEIIEEVEEEKTSPVKESVKDERKPGKSKLDIIPKNELEKIGRLIQSKQLTYKKAVEIIQKTYKDLDISIQGLKYFLATRGYIDNKKFLEENYKRMSKKELLKTKRTIIANILFEEILNDRMDEFVDILLSNDKFREKVFKNEQINKE